MVFCGFVRRRYGDSDAASQNPNTQGWCPLRLKHTFLAVTTVFAALLCLSGCGSDSGSSVLQRDVEGVWSFYEADDSYPPTAPESRPVPSSPPVYGVSNALAYGGSRSNRPTKNGFTKNLVLQLTNKDDVNQSCTTCGQAVGGSRLFGKFISINHQFLCTPDLDETNKPIGPGTWLRLYGTLEGTQIEAKVTGNINKLICSRDENIGSPPGPNNCAGLGFSGNFQHPVEIDVSGELQWEPWALGYGFCKMVFTYDKVIHPDHVTGAEPPAACNEEEQRTGEFELYKSWYQPTDTSSVNCATSVPPFGWLDLIKNYAAWSSAPDPAPPAIGGCDTRDAYRWGPILMPESECLDTYVSE